MYTSEEIVRFNFDDAKKLTKNDTAAALLALAMTVQKMTTAGLWETGWLGHEICMGIRTGLFGSGASDSASIDSIQDGFEALGRSIYETVSDHFSDQTPE